MFPWVKLIASMREPISRGISMLAHNLDKSSIGCLTRWAHQKERSSRVPESRSLPMHALAVRRLALDAPAAALVLPPLVDGSGGPSRGEPFVPNG